MRKVTRMLDIKLKHAEIKGNQRVVAEMDVSSIDVVVRGSETKIQI